MPLHINSPGWQIRRASRSRPARDAGADLASLPADLVAAESRLAEEAILQRIPSAVDGGALDITYVAEPAFTAVLAVRHASGALTFSLPIEATSRDARGTSTTLRFQVPLPRAASRGIADKIIKAIVIEVAKVAADRAVSLVLPRLAEALEQAVWNHRRLREGWLGLTQETLTAGRLEPRTPVSPRRSLLLLHGSFSNAAATFRPLVESDFFGRIESTYGDRIFAFDYFSISRAPDETARAVLESLPEHETTFDVVTHGIGGLVLRTIVERSGLLGPLARRFKLGHAVLVASPNEGTTLASSRRWDGTLAWLANVLEMFPDNPFTTGSAFVANGLAWLANHALGDLPGLRAMDPNGGWLDAIQRSPEPPSAYSVLVANYQPKGAIVRRLLDMGVDHLFEGANDLVVPAEGAWRLDRSGASYVPASRIGCFGPGGNLPADSVTHLGYFTQPATVEFIANALLGHQQPFEVVDPRRRLPDRRLLRGATDAPAARPASVTRSAPGGDIELPAAEPPLHITVVNGNLTFEREALLLGHYRASRLSGTEKVMDELIGGTMSRSLAMGVYPVTPGSHQIFINRRPDFERGTFLPRPKAVLVVGLGEEGELRAADLVLSVRQAVIAWSQRLAEKRTPPPTFTLAATLMGSGGTGVSAGEAARLIAEGVYQANQLLADGGERLTATGGSGARRRRAHSDAREGKGPLVFPAVGRLRLIELYLDRATDAWRALKLQAATAPGRYEIANAVEPNPSGLTRTPDLGYRGAAYDFITVEAIQDADGTPSIAYKLDTRRARSEVHGQRAQSRLIRELVAAGSNDKNDDEQIGRTLFDLVVPPEIEAYFAGSGEMQIELDPQTAAIPWELLDTRRESNDDPPWAIRVKLLRKLRIGKFREQVTDARTEDKALVIGEPECPQDFPRLYAARAEAVAVRACLAGGLGEGAVVGLLSPEAAATGPAAIDVVNALFQRPWRIVHVAGHGVPGRDGAPGGVVLSSGAFLGPAEIGNMRTVPELVFVNCCHLGAADARQLLNTRYDRAMFASGLAGALISLGVRCVVAAGWAVDDEGARVFAETFYGSLLRGERFIDAVCSARRETYNRDPHQNTWAAYQCYGDPDWVFRQTRADPNRASAPSIHDFGGIASAAALTVALESIHVATRFHRADPGGQLETLRQLESRHAAWGRRGDVAELFGAAFTEAGDVDAGLRWYEAAVAAQDGRASMKAVEQLANVRSRLAWERVDRAMRRRDEAKARESSNELTGKARSDAHRTRRGAEQAFEAEIVRGRELIRESLALLEKLTSISRTVERASLLGSTYKRRALVHLAAGSHRHAERDIRLMSASYAEAEEIGRKDGAADVYYPAVNRLVADTALNAGRDRWQSLDGARVKLVERSLADAEQGFWTVVGKIDLKLYGALATRRLASMHAALEKEYADLHRRVRSTRMWGSVYDTACLTLASYSARVTKTGEKKAAQALLAVLRTYAHPPARSSA